MTGSVVQFAPTGVAVAVAGYCIWPYLFAAVPAAGAKQPSKLPEISSAVLSPNILPPPERNPFDTANAGRASADDKKKGATADTVGKGGAPAGSGNNEPTRSAPMANGAGENGKPPVSEAPDGPGNPLSGLMLEATCISGNQRVAAINGRVYQEGESLRWPGGTAPACVVAHVRRDKVLLECQGKTIELKYSNGASPSGQTKGPPAIAKTAGASDRPSQPKAPPTKSPAPQSRAGSTTANNLESKP